jgi:hypothetical protein
MTTTDIDDLVSLETQIPEPGDFFAAVMGRDNVLVVRQKDHGIRAMLNTCAHRGNAVCRAEEGSAKGILYTYHGWSYRTRLRSEEDSWIGSRRDVLRRVDGSFRIADRKIFLEQTVLLSRNLSNFF